MPSKYTIPQLQELLADALKTHGSTSKEYRRYRSSLRYYTNPESCRAAIKRYRENPKVKADAYARIKQRYQTDEDFRTRMQAASTKWRTNTPEKMAAAQKAKRNNPIHCLKDKTHNKLKSALMNHVKRSGPITKGRGRKPRDFYPELGCSISEWKEHLEQQFTPDMTWDNHGSHWQIDHIIPKHKFDLPKELNACFHYTNTRPLPKLDNQQRRKNV